MMKKSLFITLIAATAVAATWYFMPSENASEQIVANENHEEEGVPKEQRIAEAMEYRFNLLKNEDGIVDPADYYAAVAQADALKQASGKSSGVLNLEWDFMGPDNVGGRTRAILFEKDTPGLMFAGSVGGRLWKSTDDGKDWNIVESYQGHSAIASIAQAPDGTIYIGTGAGLDQIGASSSNSGAIGNGIWKSTDKGDTWEQLASTNTFTTDDLTGPALWTEVNDLAVDPNNSSNIIAGARSSIMVSVDAGITWTQVAGISGQTQAVEISSDGSVAYVSVGGRIYQSESTSSFLTWTQMTAAGVSSRADVAIAPSNPDVVYVSHTNSCIVQITRTKDGGATWEQIVDNNGPDPFSQSDDNASCQGQGWYDHTIAVNPADEDKIYIGGVRFFTWGAGTNGLKRAADLGGAPYEPQYIHADKHEIIFNPHDETGNTMVIGHDGGMSLSKNALTGFPDNITYREINKNYSTFQVYGIGAGKYGDVVGGSQDNGSQYVDLKGSSPNAAIDLQKSGLNGDGGYAEVSHLVPTTLFWSAQYGNLARSISGGTSTATPFVDPNVSKGCGFVLCSNAAEPDCDGIDGSGAFITKLHLMETTQRATTKTGVDGGFLYIERIDTLGVNDYNIVLSNGESFSQTNTIIPSGEYLVNSNTIKGFQFEATTTQVLTFGDTLYFDDSHNAQFFVGSSCGVWVCTNPLSQGEEPVFYNIRSTPDATCFASSADGDVLFAALGTRLYRVSGLDDADYPAEGCTESTTLSSCFNNSIEVDNFLLSVGAGITGSIEGISVDPNDANHVIVVASGFGGSRKVLKSINALDPNPSFTSIQGDLPIFPTYDCVIDADNRDNYIIGGELGVWSSNDAGISWTEENEGINRLPVYSLRQEWMYEEGCNVIYAGTHGGGMFATTTLTDAGCNKTYGEYPDVGINDVSSIVNEISVYPNPASATANVKFELERSNTISIKVIDFMGRVVGENNYAGTAGVQEVKVDVTNYATGTYMVVLSVDGKPNASAMMIKK